MRTMMALAALAVAGAAWAAGPDLTTNGGFESGPWAPENDYRAARVDLLVSHSGGQSGLLEAVPDRARWVYGPGVPVEEGKRYLVTAWLRCEGLTDPQGASLYFLQWAAGQPQGWVWNWAIGQGIREMVQTGGTHPWRRFTALVERMAPGTATLTPFFAVRKGEGRAWLDDLEVREWEGGELPAELRKPQDGDPEVERQIEEMQVAREQAKALLPVGNAAVPEGFAPERREWAERAAAGGNIVSDPGCEDEFPGDWSPTARREEGGAHGGAACLRLAPGGGMLRATTEPVDAGSDYRLSAWVKTQDVPKGGLKLRLWPGWWNEATMSEELLVAGGTEDWQRLEITLTDLPPALDGKGWILHGTLDAGPESGPAPVAWVDDVELTRVADSLRLGTGKPGNYVTEGDEAPLVGELGGVPEGADRRLRWLVTGFWGEPVGMGEAGEAAVTEGRLRVEIPLQGRGYREALLVAEDGEGRVLTSVRVSAAVLPAPGPEATRLRPESIFACWGCPPELAPLLGVKWTRWMERTTDFVPKAEGGYDWTLAQWYGPYKPREERLRAQAAGMGTYLCFAGFADWLLRGADGQKGVAPRNWAQLGDWVREIYAPVADLIGVVEVWNEPVIPWGWPGTAEEVVQLHRTVYEAVKGVDPRAVVLGPCDSTEHLETFGKLGGFDWVDAISIHPYRQFSPEATDFPGELRKVREISQRYGPEKDLWITEMGWTTAPGRFTELEQANWLARAYLQGLAAGVRSLNIHIFNDWNNSSASEKYYGITRVDRTPKPAAVAYATLTRNLEGARFVGALEGLSRASYGYVFERDGERVTVLWNAGADGVVEAIGVGAARVRVEALDGSQRVVEAAGGKVELVLGESPVFVTGG